MVRIAFGVFLMIHGLVHLLWIVPAPSDPKWPFSITASSVLTQAPAGFLKTIGWIGTLVATSTFIFAGVGVLGLPGIGELWQLFAVTGALTSLLLLALFWNRTFVVGLIIDVGVLVAIYSGWLA